MISSMRHSISVGGRFRPPPKNWSYSILSWRMSFSSCASSSSIVAMAEEPPFLHARSSRGLRQQNARSKLPIRHDDRIRLGNGRISDWDIAGLWGTPLPLCFSQVLILKVVKVLCFDTLLQVLILKVVSQGPMWCRLEANLSSNLQS